MRGSFAFLGEEMQADNGASETFRLGAFLRSSVGLKVFYSLCVNSGIFVAFFSSSIG